MIMSNRGGQKISPGSSCANRRDFPFLGETLSESPRKDWGEISDRLVFFDVETTGLDGYRTGSLRFLCSP